MQVRCMRALIQTKHVENYVLQQTTWPQVTTCSQWALPAVELDGLWENLIYDDSIKR